MKKSIIILTALLMSFTKEHCFAEFVCLSYLQDTVTHSYCVTFQDISACGANAWSWDFDNGQTANTSLANSCFTYPGVYHVRLITTCQGGGIDSAVHTLYVDSANIFCSWTGPVGISINEFNHLNIFPNPVGNTLTVKNSINGAIIEIFSMFGCLLYKQKLSSEVENINLEFLASGIYCLRYSDMKEERLIKLVKQ